MSVAELEAAANANLRDSILFASLLGAGLFAVLVAVFWRIMRWRSGGRQSISE